MFEGKRDFAAIAVVGGKDGVASDYFPPCGVCRQVMLEFCAPDFKIYMGKQDGTYLETELRDFMPLRLSRERVYEVTDRIEIIPWKR